VAILASYFRKNYTAYNETHYGVVNQEVIPFQVSKLRRLHSQVAASNSDSTKVDFEASLLVFSRRYYGAYNETLSKGNIMIKKIKNLDPNTKLLVKAAATIVAVNVACIVVIKALETKTPEA